MKKEIKSCLFTCFLLACLFSPCTAYGKAARAEGAWKLARVEIISLKNDTSFTNGSMNGNLMPEECYDGRLSGSGSLRGKNGVIAEWTGGINWTPPPKRIEPGKPFMISIKSETKQRTGDRILLGGGVCDVYVLTVKDCDIPFTEELYLNCHSMRAKELSSREKTVTDTFEAPFQNTPQKDKLILVTASFSGATSDPFNPAAISRVFIYRYRFAKEGPQQLRGELKMNVTCTGGAPVQGFSLRVRCINSGEETDLKSDNLGKIDHVFEALTTEDSLELEFLEGMIGPGTKYDLSPIFLSTLKIPLSGIPSKLKMEPGSDRRTVLSLELPVFKLSVYGHVWSKDSSCWLPGPANLIFNTSVKVCRVESSSFSSSGNLCFADIKLPVSKILGSRVLIWAAINRMNDTRELKVPDADNRFKPVQLSFYLADIASRIARIRARIKGFLSKPEFKGVLTREQINAISNIKIEVLSDLKNRLKNSNTQEGDYNELTLRALKAQELLGEDCCYKFLNGVIYIKDENFLDVGKPSNADSVFHEWTHATMSVIADDPGVEGKVGGKHDVWLPANTEETAWDEGRAHFCSTLYTLALDTPGDMAFTPSNVKKQIKNNPGWNNPGGKVEGVITGALLQYYRDAGFRKNSEVLSHFIKVQEECKKTLGHPPRTSKEFFSTLSKMNSDNASMLKVIDNVHKEYGIT